MFVLKVTHWNFDHHMPRTSNCKSFSKKFKQSSLHFLITNLLVLLYFKETKFKSSGFKVKSGFMLKLKRAASSNPFFDWQTIFKPRFVFIRPRYQNRFHVEDAAGRFLLSHIIFLLFTHQTHILPILTRKNKKDWTDFISNPRRWWWFTSGIYLIVHDC